MKNDNPLFRPTLVLQREEVVLPRLSAAYRKHH